MKNAAFWVVTPCGLWRNVGSYKRHTDSLSRRRHSSYMKLYLGFEVLTAVTMKSLLTGNRYNIRTTFKTISKGYRVCWAEGKIICRLYIVTAVKTSNPTCHFLYEEILLGSDAVWLL
jgi:hypothetical protein